MTLANCIARLLYTIYISINQYSKLAIYSIVRSYTYIYIYVAIQDILKTQLVVAKSIKILGQILKLNMFVHT